MNNDSTRKRRVQKTLGLHYSRFYLIARCIDSLFQRKILENRSSAAPVEKVGLEAGLLQQVAFRLPEREFHVLQHRERYRSRAATALLNIRAIVFRRRP
jgi:hypothetical protein